MTSNSTETPKPEPTLDLPAVDLAELHGRFHQILQAGADQATTRQAILQTIAESLKSGGVALLTRDAESNWDLKPGYAVGRVPRRNDFVEKYAASCEQAVSRNAVHVETVLGLNAVFLPICAVHDEPAVLLILKKELSLANDAKVLETVAEYVGLWIREKQSRQRDWQLNALAAIIELIAEMESCQSAVQGAENCVNHLLNYLGATQVSMATRVRGKLPIAAISGCTKLAVGSELAQLHETVLNEAALRGEATRWPVADEKSGHLLLAHRNLAQKYGYQELYSIPLETAGGDPVGALLVAFQTPTDPETDHLSFLKAAGPRLASAIDVIQRAEAQSLFGLVKRAAYGIAKSKQRFLIAVAVLLAILLSIPVPYRVRCQCVLQPSIKREVVAPFDGVIRQSSVDAGDQVSGGQVLAQMDDRDTLLQLASTRAQLEKAKKQREIALAQRDIPQSIEADLEAKSLEAKLRLLSLQLQKSQIRNPLDGVVLSSRMDDLDGTTVRKGDLLYEVGSPRMLRCEIAIPSEDLANLKPDSPVKIWINGYESYPVQARLVRIRPKSELRNAKNVFVGELEIDNRDHRFRPGMTGIVRLDGKPNPLGWNLFHKPISFIQSRLTWW